MRLLKYLNSRDLAPSPKQQCHPPSHVYGFNRWAFALLRFPSLIKALPGLASIFGGLLTGLITYSIALLLQVYQTQQQIEKLEREHAMHAHAANSSAANSQEQQHQQAQAQEQQQTEPHEGRNGPADAFAATGMRQDGGAAPADSAATAADAQSQVWPLLLFQSHIYHRSLL